MSVPILQVRRLKHLDISTLPKIKGAQLEFRPKQLASDACSAQPLCYIASPTLHRHTLERLRVQFQISNKASFTIQ